MLLQAAQDKVLTVANATPMLLGEELLLWLLWFRHWVREVVICHAPVQIANGAHQEVDGPADYEVQHSLEGPPDFHPILVAKFVYDAPPQFDGIIQFLSGIHVRVLRDVDLAQLHVIGVPMMDRVGALPRVVRHEEKAVQDVAGGVPWLLILAECALSTLMPKCPQSHGNDQGHHRIRHPEQQGQEVGGVKDR